VVNGHLEDSLRREIESYLENRLSAVKQEITTLQESAQRVAIHFSDRQTDVQMEGSLIASITEHLHAAHERGVELAASESSRAKASSDMAIVKAGIGELYEQKSQADVLKALVNRASSFAPRVAFFVIKGEQATGWRGRGFEGTVGDEAVQQISFSVELRHDGRQCREETRYLEWRARALTTKTTSYLASSAKSRRNESSRFRSWSADAPSLFFMLTQPASTRNRSTWKRWKRW
jgi:hypothetical protein